MLIGAHEVKEGDVLQVQDEDAPPGNGPWLRVVKVKTGRESVLITFENGTDMRCEPLDGWRLQR